GRLFVRGADSMLGCLGGEAAGFDAEGWYDTGDLVERSGDAVRFLGRAAALINVGGQKVTPAEVEAALGALVDVIDCQAYALPHALTGQVVAARVVLATDESSAAFKQRMRAALRGRLEAYKIPVRVEVVDGLMGPRGKKISPR
ncbi:MAG: long-chain fatty acid--CoA ligase, partial [Myxococcales bacterium]|nr:long-chain fatty acid--CoA ligase [Myxococcales bacterium]